MKAGQMSLRKRVAFSRYGAKVRFFGSFSASDEQAGHSEDPLSSLDASMTAAWVPTGALFSRCDKGPLTEKFLR